MIRWVFLGLATQWRTRWEYGYSEPSNYVAVIQKWSLKAFGIELLRRNRTVGEISVTQWASRVPFGACSLTQEQIQEYTPSSAL